MTLYQTEVVFNQRGSDYFKRCPPLQKRVIEDFIYLYEMGVIELNQHIAEWNDEFKFSMRIPIVSRYLYNKFIAKKQIAAIEWINHIAENDPRHLVVLDVGKNNELVGRFKLHRDMVVGLKFKPTAEGA